MSRNAFNQLENEFSTALDRKETFDAYITIEDRPHPAKYTSAIAVYLNELRDRGVTNMFGATLYLQREFNLSHTEARDCLSHWMATF
jgi:hypothetical protein